MEKKKKFSCGGVAVITVLLFILFKIIGAIMNPPEPEPKQPVTTSRPVQTQLQTTVPKIETEPATTEEVTEPEIPVVQLVGTEISEYDNKKILYLTLEYTNNSDKAESYYLSISTQVFQGGVECKEHIITSLDTEHKDLADNKYLDIQPGVALQVTEAYELRDNTPANIISKELIAFDDIIYIDTTIEVE